MGDAYYVGLRKVQWIVAQHDAGEPRATSTSRSRDEFRIGAGGPALTTGREQEVVRTFADQSDATTALRQYRTAASLIRERAMAQDAEPIAVGQWFRFAGPCSYGVMARDTWSGDARPWAAMWLLEVELPATQQARWIVMTGTAEGNIREFWQGAFPGNRSGSGTEAFFDLCRSIAYDEGSATADREGRGVRSYLELASWILGMPDRTMVPSQGLAQCQRVIVEPDSGYRSEGLGLPVTELVVATPLGVEFAPPARPERRARWFTRRGGSRTPR